MVQKKTTEHKKGKVDPAKVNRNWRILKPVDQFIHDEAERMGFGKMGSAAYLNNLFTRLMNGETIQRDP